MKADTVILDFSGIYQEEGFYKEEQVSWVDLRGISGTNCYCDGEARGQILDRLEKYPASGIYFIDSGNYHYMSRIGAERMAEPFHLLVFDNHTDMQPPAFGGILSCGGWIAASMDELKNLKHVILVGPDEAAYEQAEGRLKERVTFLSRERLQELTETEVNKFLRDTVSSACNWKNREALPLYISIDKDVLCPEDAQTAWSQGDMHLTTLLAGVQTVLECAKETGGVIAGVDICGEADVESIHENEANDFANEKLLETFGDLFAK